MADNYLTLTQVSNLSDLKEKIIYKCFEILPGFLSWGTLLAALFLSIFQPVIVAVFIIIFDFFWLLRISYLSFHQTSSFGQMVKNLKVDWRAKLEKLPQWRDIYHLVVLPMYQEEKEIVESSLQSLKEADYPKEKMIVVLTVEERGGEKAKEVAEVMEKEFGSVFFRFLTTFHPKDIEGEIAGKGSNLSWGLKQARERIIDELNLPYEKIIVSNFDIDTRPYPQYFAILTWHYLTVKDPLRASFQPIPIYNNNIWQAPSFSRVIATSGTFWQMMQQERPEQLVSYSSHSLAFKTVIEVGYPANMVSDDSRIFWKAYLHYNGKYRVVPLHYPVSMDAVMAKTLFRTVINQYKQQRRWAWGAENIPYLLYGFLKNKKIPLRDKLRHTYIILDGFWVWATSALLIFFLGWLPLILGSEDFQTSLLSYNLPRFTSYIMTLAMLGMLVSAIVSLQLLPPRPKKVSRWKSLSMVLQWFLLPFTLIVFGSFPALEAQTRLLFGKYLGFWVTEKAR